MQGGSTWCRPLEKPMMQTFSVVLMKEKMYTLLRACTWFIRVGMFNIIRAKIRQTYSCTTHTRQGGQRLQTNCNAWFLVLGLGSVLCRRLSRDTYLYRQILHMSLLLKFLLDDYLCLLHHVLQRTRTHVQVKQSYLDTYKWSHSVRVRPMYCNAHMHTRASEANSRWHTHTHIYVYMYMYICICSIYVQCSIMLTHTHTFVADSSWHTHTHAHTHTHTHVKWSSSCQPFCFPFCAADARAHTRESNPNSISIVSSTKNRATAVRSSQHCVRFHGGFTHTEQ